MNNEIPLRIRQIKTLKTLLRKLRTMAETKCEAIYRRNNGKSTQWFTRSSKGKIEIRGKGFFTRYPSWQNFNTSRLGTNRHIIRPNQTILSIY
jgi:hypothetical protein